MPSAIREAAGDEQALAAWLRLTLTPGVGRRTQRKLLKTFGLPEQIFAASYAALEAAIGGKAQALLETDNKAAVEAALLWAAQPGQRILTLADADYPPQLLETPDPPTVLYVSGDVGLLSRPALAMVGSRNATPQGLRIARDFAAELSRSGLTIVSGLALGIDAAAHTGALAANGGTVAVVGTGADRLYPARNRELAQQIRERGAIITEFPLGTPAAAENFPRRNRIISGLALGVLVVEAATESGSLITARLAGEQGREVFAVPGSIHSPQSRGCHRLIRQGGKLVESARDVLEELGDFSARPEIFPEVPDAPDALLADAAEPLSDADGTVLFALGHDPITLDELALRCRMPAAQLLPLLLGLELSGKIATLPGNRYQAV